MAKGTNTEGYQEYRDFFGISGISNSYISFPCDIRVVSLFYEEGNEKKCVLSSPEEVKTALELKIIDRNQIVAKSQHLEYANVSFDTIKFMQQPFVLGIELVSGEIARRELLD